MNKRIIDKIFFLICFCLIFLNIPKLIQINIIGGLLGSKLIFYPLFIGFVYTIYCQYKYKDVFLCFYEFKKYIFIFCSITLLSTIVGLFIYPYYDIVLNGPVNQIEKMPIVLSVLNNMGIYIAEKYLVILWMIIRIIKTIFLDTFYTFGGAYMIYCWYYNRPKEGIRILLKAIVISVIIILIYSVIDVFYLLGNNMATNILIVVNPFLHEIVTSHGWWPPLLWKNQLRSIFTEPSYFGIYAAFVIPFLWYKFIRAQNIKYKIIFLVILTMFVFFLFLTRSRTAVALFMGECFILIIYIFYLKNIIFIKNGVLILIFSIISFISANILISNITITNTNKMNISTYLDDNLGSLASTDKRSNAARYSIIIAKLKIYKDYPLLGVGTNLINGYIPDYLPIMSENNKEINMWINDQRKQGILKSGYPNLCEYASQLAQNGSVGLIVFLLPAFILLKNLIKKIKERRIYYEQSLIYIVFSISLIGVLTSGLGDSINITYCYWVLLGLGYALCFGESSK